jgi:hypothetical protein
MFDVEEIVGELVGVVFQRGAVTAVHLRPAGRPRTNAPAQLVKRNMRAKIFFLLGHEGARAHQVHVAAQDVP